MDSVKNIYLLLLVSLVLLNDEFVKIADGQLDAVGAVFSVVPVTSILATAGLVGVKLAALSRLLQALGYDRAYLAKGGSGTAAHPIGLQKDYSYIFPYVPGVNISVKSEADSNYHNRFLEQQQQEEGVTRKTFPSMALPGEYENQNRPFRGSETLRQIFQESGITMRFPTKQQQQQISGLHAKGKTENQSKNDPQKSPFDQNFNSHQFATTPMTVNQPPPPSESSSGSLINHHSHPSIILPYSIHNDGYQPMHHDQPHSSSNFQTDRRPDQPHLPVQTHPSTNNRGQNIQVNMPHPHYNKFHRIPPSQPFTEQPPPGPQTDPSSLSSSPSTSHFSPTPSTSPGQSFVSTTQSDPPHRVMPKYPFPLDLLSNHFPIPQHEFYHKKLSAQQQAEQQINKPPLPSGRLTIVPEAAPLPKVGATFEDYDRYIFGDTTPSNFMPTPTTINSDTPPFHDDLDESDSISNLDHPRTLFVRRKRDIKAPEAAISIGANFGMPALNIYPLRKKRSLLIRHRRHHHHHRHRRHHPRRSTRMTDV